MATGFKKRVINPSQVTTAEIASASAPIVGDPRIGFPAPQEEVIKSSILNAKNIGEIKNLGSSQDYEVGSVYDVPLALIKSNPLNPRAIYTSTAIDEMASSLLSSGQRISATGYLDEQGYVVLIEGETRLRGARVASLPTLRVEIKAKPLSEQALYEEARAANVERRDQTPLDDALKWKELLSKKIYPTQAALAKALSLTEDYVSRTLSLSRLPHRLIITIAEYPELMTHKMLNALREFWEVKDEDEAIELILEVTKNGLGYRDVVARRKSAEKGPIKRPRSTREAIQFGDGKGEIKTFDEGGRFELVLKGLKPEQAQLFTQQVKSLLESLTAQGEA